MNENNEYNNEYRPVPDETMTESPVAPVAPAEPEVTEPVVAAAEPEVVTPAEQPGAAWVPAEDGGVYRFVRPEAERSAYSDAGYVPAAEANPVPRSYAFAEPAEKKPKREKKARTRKGMHWTAVAALCLVFALLGGAAVWGVPQLMGRQTQVPAEEQVAGAGSESSGGETVFNKAGTPATSVTTKILGSGQELSATDIYYNMAVKQTVGVTTEITYRNYFGMTSRNAVIGSGFLISENGYILTNYHVIEEAVKGGYTVNVLDYEDNKYEASIVGYEESNDVALLKIDGQGFSAATIGDSDSMLVGETVYAVGNPTGELEYTMTNGMVCALDREITTSSTSGGTKTINMFQISAAINEGNSGGPVYNSRGEIIGIATAKYSATGVEGLGFAIPINDAVRIANDLITDGYVRGKAYMGIGVSTVTASAAQYYGLVPGAIVSSINPGSCAEKAGLQEKDIIVALDGKEITSYDTLMTVKRNYHAGDSAVIKVYRSGQYLELTIVFDEETPEAVQTESQTEQAPEKSNTQQSQGTWSTYNDFFRYFFGGDPFER